MKNLIAMMMFVVVCVFSVLSGCSKPSTLNEQQEFDAIVVSYSNTIQSAPNGLSYEDITTEYEDSITKFLWSKAPFVNWTGTLTDIETEVEFLMGRKCTNVKCIIHTKISNDIEGKLLFSFYKDDIQSVYNNLQELPIGSKVYFSFVPWQILKGVKLQENIINEKFDMLGGIFYIGTKPQSYSTTAQRIVEYYDSVRMIDKSVYIRVTDSLPSEFSRLPEEEQILIKEFCSFRNLYDEHYPRH